MRRILVNVGVLDTARSQPDRYDTQLTLQVNTASKYNDDVDVEGRRRLNGVTASI